MENAKFEAYKKKLEGICDENNLVFRFRNDVYPITLTITPNSGLGAQMTMLEMADEKPFNSPDAQLVFSMEDGALTYKISERLKISDALFSKLKNLFRNMHYTYLQFFHRQCIEEKLLSTDCFPQPEADTTKSEPLEEFVDADELEETDCPDMPDAEEINPDFDDGTEGETMTQQEYLLKEATKYVREVGHANASMLAKKFGISFAAAARLIDDLEDAGVIGDYDGSTGGRTVIPFDENKMAGKTVI